MINLNLKNKTTKKLSNNLLTSFFKPNICIQNFNEINLESLKLLKITTILCDLDNTLIPHYQMKPSINALNFVKKCQDLNFKFVLISNNQKKRVLSFSKLANLDYYYHSCFKPFTFKVKNIIKTLAIDPNQSIVIGDQVITDIFLANLLKIKSILVIPMFNINTKVNFLMRALEKYIYRRLEKDNLLIKKDQKNFFSENESFYL